MDKKVVMIILAIILAIGGGLAFLLSGSADQTAKKDMTNQANPATQSTAMDQPNTNAVAGTYIDYSLTAIDETSGTKLLFFHAPWCSQCRAIETDIKRSGVPDNVTIIKVDYDSNQQLRQKYGVTIQTTLIKVDDSGNLVKKYVAYDEPTLDAIIKNLL